MKRIGIAVLLTAAFAAQAQSARVNVGHLAPFDRVTSATAVSVDVNASEVASGVVFNQFSTYLDVDAGSTTVEIFAPPGAATPAIEDTYDLAMDTDYSVLAIGDGANQPLALLALEDDNAVPTAGNAKIRIAHTAPFAADLSATAVSIRLDSGDIVNGLASVEYSQDSGFFELPAGTYDLQIASPDGSQTFIDLEPIELADGAIVTVYAVGDGSQQPLGATAYFSDGTFAALPLETDPIFSNGFEAVRVNVGHLAPFAADTMDTAVSINVNEAEALTGVTFNQFSDYVNLTPGETAIDVFTPPGAAMPAIADTFELEAATDYTVLALGDGVNQALSLLALVDDNAAPTAGSAKIRIVHAAPFDAEAANTAVSIRLDDGTVVNGLSSVLYTQDSGFFELAAGTYDLQVASPDGTTTFIDIAPVELADGDVLTIFAVGDVTNQPLGATAFFADGTAIVLGLE